ncbi:MAG: hypothetical protein OXB88_04600 [Bacteriovoracales bacterium]|nr:hypothetical protein [Bacteriovoracales bacterium]
MHPKLPCNEMGDPSFFVTALLLLFLSSPFFTVARGNVTFDLDPDGGQNVLSGRRIAQKSFPLYVDEADGSTTSPHVIYYPFISACSNTPADAKAFTLVTSPGDNAPCMGTTDLEGEILIPHSSVGDGHLYAAFETTMLGQFEIISIGRGPDETPQDNLEVEGETQISVRVDVGRACAVYSCSLPSNDVSTLSRRLLVFHSQDETLHTGKSLTTDDAVFEQGEVYNIKISRKLPSPSAGTHLPTYEFFKGDSQVFVNYKTEGLSINPNEIRALRVVAYPNPTQTSTPFCDSQTTVDGGCLAPCGTEKSCPVFRLEEAVETEERELVLSGLKNGDPLHLSVCVENKWGFCSAFPATQTIAPQGLETFLQEQSCFFFSAGFRREHRVIEELKWFRDHILAGHPWGRQFIRFYYSKAPSYALFVAETPVLRFFVRSVAHVLSSGISLYRSLREEEGEDKGNVTARTSSKNCNKGKVTVLHPDKIGRRQRGAPEACFLHVAGERRGSRLPRLPGGEQLQGNKDKDHGRT